jgi:DNA-directed RNA polymerase specialized sigma24 family protein
MGSERGATEYFFENSGALDEREPRHFFLDRDAELDPEVRRLQDLLQRKMPAIRGLLRRLLRDDSDLPEYMDRIYGRLRGALRSDTSLDETAIWRRAVSIVHEDRKRAWRRGSNSIDAGRLTVPDPESVRFVSSLVRLDQLQAFRECLDEWTRQAFDLKYSCSVGKSAQELAKRFGITRNAFYQRWKRGMDAGREEYLRRHGDPMP